MHQCINTDDLSALSDTFSPNHDAELAPKAGNELTSCELAAPRLSPPTTDETLVTEQMSYVCVVITAHGERLAAPTSAYWNAEERESCSK